jgi:putative phosphoserine phosphatase/1-acylglycerol-3-phosphate O-acyltransferase
VSPRLAPFKKGAFHLAMQAGVPMVPIVLHDAIDVAPKGTFLYRPGTVTVEVLPPVDTSSWRPATIERHVAEVRQLFLEALGQTSAAAGRPGRRSRGSAKAGPGRTRKTPAAGRRKAGA